jgi:hypothetical protein
MKKAVKETIGLGIGSMAGLSIMGSMPKTEGSSNLISTTSASLGILGAGQMMKNTNTILGNKKTKKKTGNSVLDKIMG